MKRISLMPLIAALLLMAAAPPAYVPRRPATAERYTRPAGTATETGSGSQAAPDARQRAPASRQVAPRPSLWGKISEGAKRLNPFAPPDATPISEQELTARRRAAAQAQQASRERTVRRDPNVQAASAVEPVKRPPSQTAQRASGPARAKAPAAKQPPPRKTTLFGRPKGPSRTASQYMAEEKP